MFFWSSEWKDSMAALSAAEATRRIDSWIAFVEGEGSPIAVQPAMRVLLDS